MAAINLLQNHLSTALFSRFALHMHWLHTRWYSMMVGRLSCKKMSVKLWSNALFSELFPIWSASEWSVGGLGLASKEIGTVVSFAGFVTLFIQFFIYHHLTAWLGTLRLLRVTLFICIFVFALQGFNRYLATESNALLWAGLLLNMGLKTIAQTVTITASIILVNNAATHRDALGSINALSQCKWLFLLNNMMWY